MPLNHSAKEDYSLSIMGWSKKKESAQVALSHRLLLIPELVL